MIQFSTLQNVFVEIAQCICPNCKIYLSKLNNVQGLSENVCEKLNFYKKNSFLSCFGSEISDKFMPWSIQYPNLISDLKQLKFFWGEN